MTDKAAEWRPVYGYTGIYEVSDSGVVRNAKTGRELKPYTNLSVKQRESSPRNTKDYYQVKLHKRKVAKNFYVHYLVCRNFIGPRPKNHDIDHKDQDTSNNAASNLQYKDQKGNRGRHPADCPCPWCHEARDVSIEDVFGEVDADVPF